MATNTHKIISAFKPINSLSFCYLKPRYKVTAQERGNRVTVKLQGQEAYFTRHATEIMANPAMLAEFSLEDACLIAYIAGIASQQI